jgi:subtilase family serine protease
LAPRIASSAAKYVSGVVGLSTLAQLEPLDDKPSKPAALGGVGRIKLPPVSPAQTTPSITPTVTVSTATTPTDTTTTPGEWAATASSYANGPQPCSAATAYDTSEDVSDIPSTPIVSLDSHLYTYDAFATAYDFDPLYQQGDLGQGVNVGIYELESNYETDPPAFDACYGINSPVSYVEVDGGSGSVADGGTDAGFETSLDIETISALAPDAHITVYQGNQEADTGWLDTFDAIVSADHDQVVSVSYGVCEELEAEELGSAPQAEITLFEEAAAQGQTFSVSSGDAGAEGCREETDTEVPAVDDPAADPYVTGVGGTSLQSPGNPAAGTPPTEVVWNNGPVLDAADSGGAGGGGLSTVWQMPSYQIDAPGSLGVVNSESQGLEDDAGDICAGALLNTIEDEPTPPTYYCREVPDVSASADLDEGYTVYYDGAWNGVGGTSGAAPVWSALFADADSSAGCQNAPIGFANPSLYTIAGSSSYGHDFNDITSGNNDEGVSNGDYFEAMTGYDMASGLGTPIAANLVPALCSMATPLTTTQTVTEPGTTTTITTPGTTTTVTQPGTTTVETVTGTTTTVTTPPTTQTVTTPATTETVTEPPTTQTVTQPGTTQTQTVTTPGTTVTTPSSVVTVYEYSSGGCTRMLTFSVKPHGSLRAVKAVVYINGRIVHTFSGHALKKISFKHPAPRKFKLAIISTLSNGEKAGEALVFNGCKYSTTAWFVVKK